MFFYEGLSCPVCGKPFTQADDIVSCPDCGAPHHRDCWQAHGGCYYAADHGTERQWSREQATASQSSNTDSRDAKRCPNCGADNPQFAEFCSHCGRELPNREWRSSAQQRGYQAPPFYGAPTQNGSGYGNGYGNGYNEYSPFHIPTVDPCGGVDPEEEIDGEKAKDIAATVRTNAAYYLPRFSKMARTGKHASWNWIAFFFPSIWLMYRKQYLTGSLLLLFNVLQTTLTSYVSYAYFSEAMMQTSYLTMMQKLQETVQAMDSATLSLISSLLTMLLLTNILLRILMGIFGNRLYMRHCVTHICKARTAYPEGYSAQLAAIGGTSFVLGVCAYLCAQILPNILLMLLL